MKPLRIALLFNVRHHYPDPGDLRSQRETDFDDEETIEFILKHLRECDFSVLPIEANEEAYLNLLEHRSRIDLVFNYSEGLHGLDRECHIPAILEMLQIPYTGSGPLTQALVLNKARTKDMLRAHEVPVLPHLVYHDPDSVRQPSLGFPLIVKPLSQGSSAGITNSSVVRSVSEMRDQVRKVIMSLGPPVMVEPFLEGREFSVAMLGNPPRILPLIEPDHRKLPDGYERIDSLEVKWVFEEWPDTTDYLMCPAPISEEYRERLEDICYTAWGVLGIRDLCRVDLRCDKEMNPYVMEVNSPPGLLPPEISQTSYFPLAARTAGIGYQDLLRSIVMTAWQRAHESHPLKQGL